ncbi:MAG: glycosyltransferase, partial [Candidatus Blackburnbacteria bacterium]|nr:glycosyltransferase [Candidatus Blackburnbacteria bacterium]
DSELATLYKNARAFVFQTLSEGFGLPGLEAMSVDCPVVCSAIPVLREVYGDAALYFNPQSVQDIADKIEKILENKKLRTTLVEEGQRQVKKYSWRKMAEETLDVYKEVLAR